MHRRGRRRIANLAMNLKHDALYARMRIAGGARISRAAAARVCPVASAIPGPVMMVFANPSRVVANRAGHHASPFLNFCTSP